jgi:hypothetical protein
VVPEPEVEPELGAVATVPWGISSTVYRVPSAVFTSVTGLPTVTVSVCEPLAYEPPTTETFAELLLTETSWNIGFAAGNAAPLETDSETPFTAITAEVGGAVGGAGGVFGAGVPPPPEVEPPPLDLLPPDELLLGAGPLALNGSLLSKSENDCS